MIPTVTVPPIAFAWSMLQMPIFALPLATTWTVTNGLIPPVTATTLGIIMLDVLILLFVIATVWQEP